MPLILCRNKSGTPRFAIDDKGQLWNYDAELEALDDRAESCHHLLKLIHRKAGLDGSDITVYRIGRHGDGDWVRRIVEKDGREYWDLWRTARVRERDAYVKRGLF